MLCQNCKKNEATMHIKRVINGEATESHLCHNCAQSMNVGGFFDDFSLNLPGFFLEKDSTKDVRSAAVASMISLKQVRLAVLTVMRSFTQSFSLQFSESTARQPIRARFPRSMA